MSRDALSDRDNAAMKPSEAFNENAPLPTPGGNQPMPDTEPTRTLAAELESVADGEPIIGIVLSAERSRWSDGPKNPAGKVMSWEEARPILDYDYDRGYGGVDCHALTAWTESRVLFIHEYDGSSGVNWLPRNPVDHQPDYSGLTQTYDW